MAKAKTITMWSQISISRTEGTHCWGAFGKVRGLAWIRCVLQVKKAPSSEPARAMGCWGMPSALQGWGEAVRAGEATSIMQQLLGLEGKGGHQQRSQTGSMSMGGGHDNGRKPSEGMAAPTITSSSSTSSLAPLSQRAASFNMSNKNGNSGVNSEHHMPLSLMGTLHITQSQGFLRYCLEEEEGPRRPSGAPHCPPTGVPQTLQPPGTTAEIAPFPT